MPFVILIGLHGICRVDILTILILPVHENRISFQLFVFSSVSFISVLQCSVYWSFTFLNKFIPSFIFWCNFKWDFFFKNYRLRMCGDLAFQPCPSLFLPLLMVPLFAVISFLWAFTFFLPPTSSVTHSLCYILPDTYVGQACVLTFLLSSSDAST